MEDDSVLRRRVAETVSPEVQDYGDILISDDTTRSSSFVDNLLEKGRDLMEKAEQSGFHEVSSVVQSLNIFVEAAAKGSSAATETLKSFVDTQHSHVIQQLPDELQAVMRVFAVGSETEQAALCVASNMFDAMAGVEPGSTIPKDQLTEAAQKLMAREVEVVGPTAAKSADDLRHSINKLLFIALVDSEQGPVVSE